MRQSLAIDPRRTALLLVDLQEEQRHIPRYAVAKFDAVLANARSLLEAARGSPVAVIHAAYRRDLQAVPPRPLEPLSADGSAAFSDKNSPLTAICREVAPRGG